MTSSVVQSAGEGGRNLYIDMLRGVAILLVMLLHYNLMYRLVASPLQDWIATPVLRTILYNGNYGVSIFFVISGFLITSNIIRRYGSLGGIDVRHFYRLRFFRLYPLVVIVLGLITALGLAGLSKFSNLSHGSNLGPGYFVVADLSVLTFWHNILMERAGYFNYAMNIYWSLSVEEVFYLLYPLALLVVRRGWQLAVLAGVFIITGPVYRHLNRGDELFFMYGNLACMDMMAYGCIAALAAHRLKFGTLMRAVVAAVACVVMGWVYMRGIGGNEALGATFLGIAAAVCLVAVSGLSAGVWLGRLACPLAWIGARSYELYLFHIVVLGVMAEIVPRADMTDSHKLPMLALFFSLSAVVAWVMGRFCGDPLNRWLRRRFAQSGVNPKGQAEGLSPS